MRRILHVVHGYYPQSSGGTEAYVRSLIAAQMAQGLQPLLLHGSFSSRSETCIEERTDLPHPSFRLHRSDCFSDYWDRAHDDAASRLFREFLRRERPDLVHLHQWIRLSDDLIEISESLGIPSVLTLHDLYSSCPACFRQRPDEEHCERSLSFEHCHDCVPLRGPESELELRLGIELYRENYRNEVLGARKVIAATFATRELVCRGLGLPRECIQILPLGYERRFAALQTAPYRVFEEGETLRLAYWGIVTQRKGVQVLLDALALIDKERRIEERIELVIFGRIDKPALEDDLRARAKDLPVLFGGSYAWEDLAKFNPHLAIFPSTCFETYGLVLNEAFELGVPSLVTDVGAFQERLEGGGFLVPPKEAKALAKCLTQILAQPKLLEEKRREIPRLSVGPEEHAVLLTKIYDEAIAMESRKRSPVAADKRLEIETLREQHDRKSRPEQRGLTLAENNSASKP